MLPLTVHHHPYATSAALTAALLTRFPTAHAPTQNPNSSTFSAFPTQSLHTDTSPSQSTLHKDPNTASPTFTNTSSLYRSALPELAPPPGQQPKKAFIQLLTLSSHPNLTYVSSSFPLDSSSADLHGEDAAKENPNDETPEARYSKGTVALHAGEQTRSFVMLLSTRLGGLWAVARGWDVVVEGRRWIVSVPLPGTSSGRAAGSRGPLSIEGAVETRHDPAEYVEVEIGIGDVSLRGVAGSTREGQRGAIIFGKLVQDTLPAERGHTEHVKENAPRQLVETALQEVIEAIKLDAGIEGMWEVIQSNTDDQEDEVQVWSRVLRSKASGQVPMARSGSRQKS